MTGPKRNGDLLTLSINSLFIVKIRYMWRQTCMCIWVSQDTENCSALPERTPIRGMTALNMITALQIRDLCLKWSTSALLKGAEWGAVAGVKIGCYGMFSWSFLVCSLWVFAEVNNIKCSSSHYTSLARWCLLSFPLFSAWPPQIPLLCTTSGASTLTTFPSPSGNAVFGQADAEFFKLYHTLPQLSILNTVHSITITIFLF